MWQWYVPPCRPSRFELELCTQQIDAIRRGTNGRRARVLVLGSTTEYRDWGFEEGCSVVVADNSVGYHEAISEARRYKAADEELVITSWNGLDFKNEFDLVVGDLVVGNIDPSEIPVFLSKIHTALNVDGQFLTKSFFLSKDTPSRNIDDCFAEYNREYRGYDAFSIIAYELAAHCVDRATLVLEFDKMYDVVKDAVQSGKLPPDVLPRYEKLGWHKGSKIEFNMISFDVWESLLQTEFKDFETFLGPYPWSKNFPIYVAKKNSNVER